MRIQFPLVRTFSASLSVLSFITTTWAMNLDLTSIDSIKAVSRDIAYDMMSLYTGNKTGDVPGNLPEPYYWWEAGAMFGSLIDYWYYTVDDTYNTVTIQALLHQVGPDENYMPPNQTKTLGNDDQAFWALAAMSAAEVNFPNPPPNQPQWLALAQAVFNTQAHRWNTETCGGGLKWQIFAFNNGYNYKNAISNGCFFNLASRLAKYTCNQTYVEWAERAWDWTRSINMIDGNYFVYDGSDNNINCTRLNHIQWSYNAGTFLLGAANMYNITNGSSVWRDRVEGMMKGFEIFFPNGKNIAVEVACEDNYQCNVDQHSFKAYMARWMTASSKLAPFIHDNVMAKMSASAAAAALQCSGGTNGRWCGLRWQDGAKWDGTQGVGQQMAALEVIQANLIDLVAGPLTNSTGGTSVGDPAAGSEVQNTKVPVVFKATRRRDKIGAGIVTVVLILSFLGMVSVMIC